MAEIIEKNLGKFLISVILVVFFIVGFLFLKNFSARAQEQIKIVPESFSGDWQNPAAVFFQDLGPGAVFGEFNLKNSAYPYPAETVKTKKSFWTRIKNIFQPEAQAEISLSAEALAKVAVCQNGANQACGTEIGVCRIGVQICSNNVWGECIGEVAPSPEICDGVDNDCDGQVDEGGVCDGAASAENSSPRIEKTLTLSGFGITPFENTKIKLAQLRLSLAGKGSAGDKLIIDYFYPAFAKASAGKQNQWQNLAIFNLEEEISNNLNVGYFLFGLPIFENWQDLDNLKIRFQVSGLSSQVYLDAVWLDVEYEESIETKFQQTAPVQLPQAKNNWRANEEPEFEIAEAPQGFWEKVAAIFQTEETKAVLIDPAGNETPENIVVQGNKIKIIKTDNESFKPGLYKLQIKIIEGGKEFVQEYDFRWGVLAINANKSIYSPQERAFLQMAALTDAGHTICNANLKLEVTPPNEGSPTPINVERSGKCGPDNVVDVPDYFAYYKVGGTGIYQMKLTNLGNSYEITDAFEVRESVPFDVERIGPTRIYPLADYEMKFKIKVNQNFIGEVREAVPSNFVILGDLSWQVDWKAGETHELKYTFDAPDISPYLYLLGPLKLTENSSPLIFQEARMWQIAADATTQVVLNLTTQTSYTIPSDFSASNTIHVIGAGGGGRTHSTQGAGGGGGGGYSATSSVELILPDNTVTINVPATSTTATNGGNAYFCKDQVDCSAISGASVIVGANGGSGTNAATGGAGGSTTGAVGGVLYVGGTGGDGDAGVDTGGGGGGAAGPGGIGKTGGAGDTVTTGDDGGGGGGGAGGGSSTVGSPGITDGGQGGAGPSGLAGTRGAAGVGGPGGNGNNGGGGGGGDEAAGGGKGGNGTEWGAAGAGGGGGGVGNCGTSSGGDGGLYGGGGGGACLSTLSNGAQGVIVIQYTPDADPTGITLDTPTVAETTSTTPVFRITGTDSDANIPNSDFSYRVVIYDESSCSTIVQFIDLAVDSPQTGWQGMNSDCVNITDSSKSCYKANTQGVHKLQTALVAGRNYWWRGAVQDPDYSKGFATSSCTAFATEGAGNTAPNITTGPVFHDGNAIVLEEWAAGDGTTTATTTFTVTDTDGWDNISTTIYVYHSDEIVTGNCSSTADDDIVNCYPATSSDNGWSPYYGTYPDYRPGNLKRGCALTATTANTADFWCTTTFYYVASSTDADATIWTVFASTSDKGGLTDSVSVTASVDVNTLRALIVDLTTIDYSSVATLTQGTNTGTNWVTTTATTTGNIAVDIHLDGGNLTVTGKTAIKAYNQRFTTTTGANIAFGDEGTLQLPTSTDTVGQTGYGKTHDVTMRKPTTTTPGPTAADKILWGIQIPASQPADTYSSTTNFTATTTIINP